MSQKAIVKAKPSIAADFPINAHAPFGKQITNLSLNPAGQKLRYNGKKLQTQNLGGRQLDWYDYGARFYDPTLGRWHSVDPLAGSYESFGPYNFCGNNPISFFDPFGLDIVNAHEKEKEEAENRMLATAREKERLRDNKKSDDYKAAKTEYRQARRNYNSVNSKFKVVERAIEDLKKYNEPLFNKLDGLTDPGDTRVDVHVSAVNKLTSKEGKPIDGAAETQPSEDFGSYYSVKSQHGDNTVGISLDKSLVEPGFTLSHEGGHVTYNVANLKEYTAYKNQHPKDDGHSDGNKSGAKAMKQEGIYRAAQRVKK